ncbi:DUF171-domain-containing protein [Zopfia rhizophila CBS 207.26]|uniref:DUF171-domain-containing protein n=1 Tax=Zopfia rhizophila CBS 207.26 TaxID=1314779 RepID=A0A6A6DF11_9PEZI|nr:DUF171-domain-containing protein [Zopfia rhizophila CBS 207.26]
MSEKEKAKKRQRTSVVLHQGGDDEELCAVEKQGEESVNPFKKRKSEGKEKKKEKRREVERNGDGNCKSETPVNSFKKRKSEGKRKDSRDVRSGDGEIDTSRPSAVFKPKKGRDWTLSIALPGSFIANVRTFDQKASLASRIARAAAVFCVDEIIVFDDDPSNIPPSNNAYKGGSTDYWNELIHKEETKKNVGKTKAEILAEVNPEDEPWQNPDQFLFHILSFLECPGHLRKYLFPYHPNLKNSGAFPTLDMPHHMKRDEWCQYREGVTLDPKDIEDYSSQSFKKGKNRILPKEGPERSYVDCGLPHPVQIPVDIPPNVRVTLKFEQTDPPHSWPKLSAHDVESLGAEPVTPSAPREEEGYYWGYGVRRADSLSAVYTESPFEDGYDFTLGTSERGVPLSSILPSTCSESPSSSTRSSPTKLPKSFQHLLLVFGGVTGLEPAVVADPELKKKGLTKETASEVFDAWVNLVPGQGSRTIRTEEAVWIGLMGLRGYVDGTL